MFAHRRPVEIAGSLSTLALLWALETECGAAQVTGVEAKAAGETVTITVDRLGGTLVATRSLTCTIQVPPGAVSEPITLTHTSLGVPTHSPTPPNCAAAGSFTGVIGWCPWMQPFLRLPGSRLRRRGTNLQHKNCGAGRPRYPGT